MFHRVDDYLTLDGPRFFRFAHRLSAYAGVMQARAAALEQEERDGGGAPAPAPRGPASAPGEKVTVISDTAALALLSRDGWVEHVKEG